MKNNVLLGLVAAGTLIATVPTIGVHAASSNYLTSAKKTSFVKATKKTAVGFTTYAKKPNKTFFVKKGTVLAISKVSKSKGKVYAYLNTDVLSTKVTKNKGTTYVNASKVALAKSNFKLVKAPSKVSGKQIKIGKVAGPYKNLVLTSDNYLEYNGQKAVKITKFKQAGKKTYVYYKKNVKGLKNVKLKNAYRLTIKAGKIQKINQTDGANGVVGYIKVANYTVGGKAAFVVLKNTVSD
ncbi:hypothetical protein EQG49_00110 [Periweissella cryptocerci]|uniref:Surface layer protein A domain-containing protein n=1 Tax=Periweissella cryptocerci TaxID=2506420 RepID=A0A4P6YQS7_9LACO|nr:hypothetical protein [Periweissella cryptocerci]QBO34957.1 hypothetical protein EQG49_00110 [Periweissella cryptocerci]